MSDADGAEPNLMAAERPDADDPAALPGMQALVRGFAVIDLVAAAPAPMRFTSILEASGLPKGSLHRTLQTLVDARYLEFDQDRQTYALGSTPFRLAHRVWDQFDLRGAAAPELQRLAELTGEAVRLGILDGDEVLYIDQRDTPQAVRLANGVGLRLPVHSTALGKAMAAHLNALERRRLIAADLVPYTDRTIVEPGDLDRQLNIVKARGYAISIAEQHDDVSAAAAPILDHQARPVGAIGIVAPSYRADPDRLHAWGQEVIRAARHVTGNVGGLAMSIAVNPRPIGASHSDVRCAVRGEDFLGEGPFWSPGTGRLHWVDILAPALLTGDPATGARELRPMPELIGAAVPRRGGGLVLATETGIRLMSETGETTRLAEPEADRPGNRFNDGKADAAGRLWVGSLAINTEPGRGRLWRIAPDGDAAMMADGIDIANGLDWSPDNRTFYFTDSGRRTIWAYDFDGGEGTLARRRPFARLEAHEGTPDGLTVDAEGGVWTAIWDGWAVRRYDPEGRVERVVELPVPRPTSCCFGGPDLTTLFVTSARIRLSARHLREAPLSGSVLAVETGIAGRAASEFAG